MKVHKRRRPGRDIRKGEYVVEFTISAGEVHELRLREQSDSPWIGSRELSHQADITKVAQKNNVYHDHSWASPLHLTASEVKSASRTASLTLGTVIDTAEPVLGGRSGAAVYALATAERRHTFMRVTSLRRALRESFTVQHVPSARALWIDDTGLRAVSMPEIVRPYPVTITLARYITGVSVHREDGACARFSVLFESPPLARRAGCPSSVVRLLSWLIEHWRPEDQRPRAALNRALGEEWRCAIGHGDPAYANLLSTDDGVAPVDFAGGGLVAQRIHRARWVNTVHWRTGEVGQCGSCREAEKDPIALLVDASRRLRSDAGDRVRERVWSSRVDDLLELVI